MTALFRHTNHQFSETRGMGTNKFTYHFPLTNPQLQTLNNMNVLKINQHDLGIIDVTTEYTYSKDGDYIDNIKKSLVLPNGKIIWPDYYDFANIARTIDGNFQARHQESRNSYTKYAHVNNTGEIIKDNMEMHYPTLWHIRNSMDTKYTGINPTNNPFIQILFNYKDVPMWIAENIEVLDFDNEFAAIRYFSRGGNASGDRMSILHRDLGLIVHNIDLSIAPTWFDNRGNDGCGDNLLVYHNNDYQIFNPENLRDEIASNPQNIGKKCLHNQFKIR